MVGRRGRSRGAGSGGRGQQSKEILKYRRNQLRSDAMKEGRYADPPVQRSQSSLRYSTGNRVAGELRTREKRIRVEAVPLREERRGGGSRRQSFHCREAEQERVAVISFQLGFVEIARSLWLCRLRVQPRS